jgi:hypothetical protein
MMERESASMQIREVFVVKRSQYVLFSFLVALLSELMCTGLVTSETTNQGNVALDLKNQKYDAQYCFRRSVTVHLTSNFDPKEHLTVSNYVNSRE